MEMNENDLGRKLPNKESDFQVAALDDVNTQDCLRSLLTLYQSSFGPNGRVKILHNNSGGCVTLTSSSGRLMQILSISNPLARVVNTAIEGHLTSFSDGGLLLGTFSLILIENSVKLEIHRRLLSNIYDLLLHKCLDYLTSPTFPAQTKLSFSHIDTLLKEITSIVKSKWLACGITPSREGFYARLLLKSFLQIFPESNRVPVVQDLQYLVIDREPLESSQLLSGMLFEAPHIPVYSQRPITVKLHKDGPNAGRIRVAMLSVSMAGDSDEFVDAEYEVTNKDDFCQVILQKCQIYVEKLIELQVGAICCQRVIHPRIKKMLRERNIFAVDRLGAQFFQALLKVTGAVSVGSFTSTPYPSHLGWLDQIEHLTLYGKSYIQFTSSSSPLSTLLLCARSEQQGLEMKYVAKSCMETLVLQLKDSRLLCGGGCWQSVMCRWLKYQVRKYGVEWCSSLACSRHQLNMAMESFIHSIYRLMALVGQPSGDHLVDVKHGHFWSLPTNTVVGSDWCSLKGKRCQCGAVSNEDGLLDFEFLLTKYKSELSLSKTNDFGEVDELNVKNAVCFDSFLPYVSAF